MDCFNSIIVGIIVCCFKTKQQMDKNAYGSLTNPINMNPLNVTNLEAANKLPNSQSKFLPLNLIILTLLL